MVRSVKLTLPYPRWNRMSIGRGAVLARQGKTKRQIASHFLKRYGREWRIRTHKEMMDFLFTVRQGRRPNFERLFMDKPHEEILRNYRKTVRSLEKVRKEMKVRRADPKFSAKQKRTIKRLWRKPEWRADLIKKFKNAVRKKPTR